MGHPKNSTRARRILIAKTPTHRLCRIAQDRAEDWAPTKARNGRRALRILGSIIKGSGTKVAKKMCCCRQILYNQDDFKEQKSLLQELYENAGHLCLYYPKFHCKLNFIEQYWGNAKFRYRETPLTTNDNEMIKNMQDCLDAIPVESIR